MKWIRRNTQRHASPSRTASQDAEVARLTARADLILEELDVVVQEMSSMLQSAYRTEKK